MKSKSVISGLMAVCMVASTPVFAQHNDRGNNGNDQNQQGQGNNNGGHGQDRGNNNDHGNGNGNNGGGHHGGNDYRQAHNGYNGERGAGPRHDMRRGGRLSSEYRRNQYVVNAWRGHHLSAPPRGSHWVQTGSDYVLVGIATGLITQVMLNN
jgi:Ni/Co efflux regulator RcnB